METGTVTTELSPKEVAVQKAQTTAQKRFELVVAEAKEVALSCKAIKITDSTSLSMAEQILSKANGAYKKAEEQRKGYNKPYADQIAFVNGLVKDKITNPLLEGIEHGKAQMRLWNEAEATRKKQEEEANQKFYLFLKGTQAALQRQVDLAITPQKCDTVISAI